jgi:hypothetical protein
MTDLREAAQQALEALEERYVGALRDKAMDALRAALEQPSREWKGLKEWEINDGREQLPTEDLCNWSFRQGVYFAEAALKERNA